MNKQELSAVRKVTPFILDNLDVKDIVPYLWQHDLVSQSVTDELLELNETRRSKCQRFLNYILSVDSKCTFEGLLSALRFKSVHNFIADQLQNECVTTVDSTDDIQEQNVDVHSTKQIDEQPRKEMLCQNVRKIEIVTRKNISAVSVKLKRLSHNAQFDTLKNVASKIKRAYYKTRMKQNGKITSKMFLADMHFVSLETLFGMRREQYKNFEDAHDYLQEMNNLIPFTKDPTICSMVYLSRLGSAVAMETQNAQAVDDGLSYLQFAKEHAEHISPGKDTGMVYYIETNLLFEKYETNPSSEMKTKILNTIEIGMSHFAEESEDVKRDLKRQLMIKMAYCYLGLGIFGNRIENVAIENSDVVHAKNVIDCIETSEMWDGMEKRRKMLFYHVKAEYYRQIGNMDLSRMYARQANRLAEKYHWTKELQNTSSLLNGLGSQAKPTEATEEDIYHLLDEVVSD
ncbi:uncharacterized protein LOC127879248 [Dreissena polymorpha]|uniref:CARD domain-containing protein n=1 Tax=Dreissena polymorpha TaxID=45954 RepID=A0A9D4QKJ1_DREPO|nr:uncharacterized protein LOC127879248 [Dreissena polymorpha]KAH3833745.1 hypothetical protein DPMN_107061 [Dreissena polymorpha]